MIDLISRFCILSILLFNSPPSPPPKNNIPNHRSDWNFVKQMFQIMFGPKISLRDFIIKDTLLNLFANDSTWKFHFNVSVIWMPRNFVAAVKSKFILLKVTWGFNQNICLSYETTLLLFFLHLLWACSCWTRFPTLPLPYQFCFEGILYCYL